MTKPPLTVQNAEITTARVEIKTLTVSGKQVTLAVFRQLRNVAVLNEDGTFAGEPWGTVNYHPDKCDRSPAHWHVVWQHGNELLRSAVGVEPDHEVFWPDEADRFATACVYELAATGTTRFWNGKPPLKGLADEGIVLREEGTFPVRMALSPGGMKVAAALLEVADADHPDRASTSWYQSRYERAQTSLTAATAALKDEIAGYGSDLQELFRAYKNAIADEAARRERHAAARQTIAELPQLFIAV